MDLDPKLLKQLCAFKIFFSKVAAIKTYLSNLPKSTEGILNPGQIPLLIDYDRTWF